MRLIDADVLISEIEDHAEDMTSETVKAGLRLAVALIDRTPTARTQDRAVYVDAEEIARRVVQMLEKDK